MESPRPIALGYTLADYRRAYAAGESPRSLLSPLFGALDREDPAWITLASPDLLDAQLTALERHGDPRVAVAELPLYGVPFAVKDNIDAHGFPTTAACPAFAYQPAEDAEVVRLLRAAGAVVFGKTNLDQFATGLVGVRSPYGAVPNTVDGRYVSGGSSSGSGSVVARGLVPFALGTDTAGSGRVPAAFNSIVGLKPSLGRLSTRGVVPACRTLDCVSVFALTVGDADFVADVAGQYDAADPYARPRKGTSALTSRGLHLLVPAELSFFGDLRAEAAFAATLKELESCGATLERIDFSAFSALAELLYQGPWVAERYAVLEQTLLQTPEAVDTTVRTVVEGATRFSALDAFRAEYRRAELARHIQDVLAGGSALVVPTTPTIYRTEEVLREPVLLNSRLGTYTNFVNLADLCALALQGVPRSDGLPAGFTLITTADGDARLTQLGRTFEAHLRPARGVCGRPAAPATVNIAVVGAHLRGLALHPQLEALGATFVESARTAAVYKLFALPDTRPAKPGMVRSSAGGSAIEVEVFALTPAAFGAFVAAIPAPLSIGTVELSDGRSVKGFLCEPTAVEGARDISAFGGFRAYLASLSGASLSA